MKIRFPLLLKVSLWLLVNLALLAAAGLGLLVSQGGLGWEGLVRGSAGDRGQELADFIARDLSLEVGRSPQDAVLDRYGAEHGVGFALVTPEGRLLAGADPRLPAAVLARLQPPGPRNPSRRTEGGPRLGRSADDDRSLIDRRRPPDRGQDRGRRRFFVKTDQPVGYWVGWRVSFEPPDRDQPEAAILLVHATSAWSMLRLLDLQPWILAGFGVLALSLLLWLPFVHGVTRALGQLTAATGRIAEGRFETRVSEGRGDELGALGRSVNRMADRLDNLVHGQRRFLGDIAHELGSPIGRMQVAIEILDERCDPALRPQVADVREEIERMGALVAELLEFTRAGFQVRDTTLGPVGLAELAGRVLDREDAARRVQVMIPRDLSAWADAGLIERALGNLVRNALRYAAEAGPVTLVGRVDGAEAVLTLADTGPGVPAEALARLGEPFFRPDAARTREDGGVGLGLAIVRSSLAACRGTVIFRNRTPRGFEAEVRLRREA